MIEPGFVTAQSPDLYNTGYEVHEMMICASSLCVSNFEIELVDQAETLIKPENEESRILEKIRQHKPYLAANPGVSAEADLKAQKQTRAIIKVPPKDETKIDLAYYQLTCTAYHKETIGYIISSMGTQSYFWLFRHFNELKDKGKEIHDVHPLKFLETIFSPEGRENGLRNHMEAVMDSRFTRTNFIEGLGASLTKRSMEGQLHIYREDFAKAIEIHAHEIDPHFQNHDWEGMVRHLMKIVPRS